MVRREPAHEPARVRCCDCDRVIGEEDAQLSAGAIGSWCGPVF